MFCIEWIVPLLTPSVQFLTRLLQHSQVKVLICSRHWTLHAMACKQTGNFFALLVYHTRCNMLLSWTGLCSHLQVIVQMERIEYRERMRADELKIALYGTHNHIIHASAY
jgi:hypothetical protein